LSATLDRVGIERVTLNAANRTVSYRNPGVELNLGGIGKGFALDRVNDALQSAGVTDVLLHGGKSSILAAGGHSPHGGWPVGVRNPLFPNRRMATLLLRNAGMSTSGAGVQFFRHEGKRYGHILDPRTGMPAEGVLSVTVLAPTAAEADALSTAFFVMGLEKSREYCDNHREVTVLLTPPPTSGRMLKVHAFNLPEQTLFLGSEHQLIDERD
jgi:thiamine biosynthesis lipoprotein